MLDDTQRAALKQWYSEDALLDHIRQLIDSKAYVQLEEYMHKQCLIPLARHAELPDYMKTDEGAPLFPRNLNPKDDEEGWQDAIELGWEVIEQTLGFSQDRVHRSIGEAQKQDWQAFLDSVEQRKKERGQP